jgi:hypothetical protein
MVRARGDLKSCRCDLDPDTPAHDNPLARPCNLSTCTALDFWSKACGKGGASAPHRSSTRILVSGNPLSVSDYHVTPVSHSRLLMFCERAGFRSVNPLCGTRYLAKGANLRNKGFLLLDQGPKLIAD